MIPVLMWEMALNVWSGAEDRHRCSFADAVIEHSNNKLERKEFILACGFRGIESMMIGTAMAENSGSRLITPHLHTGSVQERDQEVQ